MAASTGIVLTATAISFANQYLNTSTAHYRILGAGLGLTLLFDGIEHIDPPFAVGLATIFLITVLVTPVAGSPSPGATVVRLLNTTQKGT